MPEIRKLAAGASEEVGDLHARLRAHTTVLQAVRETQVEHTQLLAQLNERIDDTGFEMRKGFVNAYEQIARIRKETCDEFANVRGEMRQGFANVRGEMRQEFAKVAQEFANVRGEMQEGFAKIATLIQDRAKPGEP